MECMYGKLWIHFLLTLSVTKTRVHLKQLLRAYVQCVCAFVHLTIGLYDPNSIPEQSERTLHPAVLSGI